MELKPGSRWKSAPCDTEVVVVRPSNKAVMLECGGHRMVPAPGAQSDAVLLPDFSAGTLIGKRYFDEETRLEVLVAKGGAGSLSVDGRLLHVKEAKALPSSD
jgi:hypothetical protein